MLGVFELYAAPLIELDNVKFAKLVRHAGLVDHTLSSAEADLCFALSKPHGKRKLSYDEFLIALDRIAAKKFSGVDPDEAFARIEEQVLQRCMDAGASAKPHRASGVFDKLTNVDLFTGSHREKFHELLTGAGRSPSTAPFDLSQMTRSNLNTGSTLISPRYQVAVPPRPLPRVRVYPCSSSLHSVRASSAVALSPPPAPEKRLHLHERVSVKPSSDAIREAFVKYCEMSPSPSPCELDCAKLVKLMREARLLDTMLTSVDIDVTFCRVKHKGERRISFPQFLDLLCMLAERKYPEASIIESFRVFESAIVMAASSSGKSSSALLKTDAVVQRLTNSDLYTGMYKERAHAAAAKLR